MKNCAVLKNRRSEAEAFYLRFGTFFIGNEYLYMNAYIRNLLKLFYLFILLTSHQLRRGLWTRRYGRLDPGKDISGSKVSQEVGNGRQVSERARRWESGIECLRRSGASWGQENKWETVAGKSES